ncbi:MAG: hypothetical protein H0X62_00545 [Bacteroidetes bacterium]|nr:hypothetical protein [Bacteroidota bacterium]
MAAKVLFSFSFLFILASSIASGNNKTTSSTIGEKQKKHPFYKHKLLKKKKRQSLVSMPEMEVFSDNGKACKAIFLKDFHPFINSKNYKYMPPENAGDRLFRAGSMTDTFYPSAQNIVPFFILPNINWLKL